MKTESEGAIRYIKGKFRLNPHMLTDTHTRRAVIWPSGFVCVCVYVCVRVCVCVLVGAGKSVSVHF